ncbi:UNVERIFIED_CONTAM: hypothetical protein Slati_1680800 [Sesamum latifolium]|uniref:Uncharacterized protein n=1 Tax=Sesamum latifolium TaxID=2727402 RepID=A0AAW2WX77_9LAMI
MSFLSSEDLDHMLTLVLAKGGELIACAKRIESGPRRGFYKEIGGHSGAVVERSRRAERVEEGGRGEVPEGGERGEAIAAGGEGPVGGPCRRAPHAGGPGA